MGDWEAVPSRLDIQKPLAMWVNVGDPVHGLKIDVELSIAIGRYGLRSEARAGLGLGTASVPHLPLQNITNSMLQGTTASGRYPAGLLVASSQ